MNTPFTEIYEIFFYNIKDYKIDDLAKQDEEDLYIYLKGMLISSMSRYATYCNLEYDDTSNEFKAKLTLGEKSILGKCMAELWLEQNIQEDSSISAEIRGRDIKGESRAVLLKRKSDHLATLREDISHLIGQESIQRIRSTIK